MSASIIPVCPDDLCQLHVDADGLGCQCCGRRFPIVNEIAELLPREVFEKSSVESMQLNSYGATFSGRPDKPWYQYLRSVVLTLGAGYLYSWATRDVEEFAKGRSLSILDAACGDGAFRVYLSSRHSYIGLDFSARPLFRAQRYRSATYYRADLNHIPFPTGTFDVAVSLQAIQYLARPEFALAELARVLRPGGRLLLTVPNRQCFKYRWQGIPRIQLQRFDRKTLGSLLSRDFDVERLQARGMWVPIPKLPVHIPGVYGAGFGLSWTALATPRK